jgi:hypothetical protein
MFPRYFCEHCGSWLELCYFSSDPLVKFCCYCDHTQSWMKEK